MSDFRKSIGNSLGDIISNKNRKSQTETFHSSKSEGYFFFDPADNSEKLFDEQEDVVKESGNSCYTLKRSSYPVANAHAGFSYPEPYSIPYFRFKEVFGESFNFNYYVQLHATYEKGGWCGNCFGMSSTSVLTNEKKLSLGKYQDQTDHSITATSFDNIVTGYGGYKHYSLNRESELTGLIERYQIFQYSDEFQKARYESIKEDCTKSPATLWQLVLNGIRIDKRPYVVSIRWIRGGHAMVTDVEREPKSLGNGWFRIFLYDPNNPYAGKIASVSDAYYRQAENRFVDVNINTGEWKMNAIVDVNGNAPTPYDVIGTNNKNSSLSFYRVDFLPGGQYQTGNFCKGFVPGANVRYYFRTSNLTVRDEETGAVLMQVEDGAVTDRSHGAVIEIPVLAGSGDSYVPEGFLVSERPLRFTLSEGTVARIEDEGYRGVTISDKCEVSFEADDKLLLSSARDSEAFIVMQKGDEDCFTSFGLTADLSKGSNSFMIDGDRLNVDCDGEFSASVRIINERGEAELKKSRYRRHDVVDGRASKNTFKKNEHKNSK